MLAPETEERIVHSNNLDANENHSPAAPPDKLHDIEAAAANLLAACKAVREAHGVWSDSEDADLVGFPFHRVDRLLDAAIKRMEEVV